MNVIQKNISTIDNIKINGFCFPHEPENKTLYIGSDNLYRWYDFSSGNMFKVIIDQTDIRQIAQSNFKYVDPKTIKIVFEIAKQCDIAEDIITNFIVYDDGRILLGGDMRKIKENLDKIKDNYDRFLKRECDKFNIIEIEVVEET